MAVANGWRRVESIGCQCGQVQVTGKPGWSVSSAHLGRLTANDAMETGLGFTLEQESHLSSHCDQ